MAPIAPSGKSNSPYMKTPSFIPRQKIKPEVAPPMIRIGHCQAICQAGNFELNLARVVEGLKRAARERVKILCFSECFLTGYFDREGPARRSSFALDSPRVRRLLARTRRFDTTFIVGFNEEQGQQLYNTALVARRGRLLGAYRKCSAYLPFHRQGREFPVFEHDGLKFGVVICSDGGYIEPTRILALKGAQVVLAPHANYIQGKDLLGHFMRVRADHAARAVENNIWFVRGNNVIPGRDPATKGYAGVGYGDSYIMDPNGEIVVRSRRHQEDFIFADVPLVSPRRMRRSRWSAQEFGTALAEAAGKAPAS